MFSQTFDIPARLRFAAVIGLTGVLCAGSAVAWSQQEANFRADVELVLLHVAVIDPRGGEVPALTPEDFTIYDDAARQDIELFASPSDAPLDIGLVLDFSGSMAPVEIAARRAAITFLTRLSPEDCVYALPFSGVIEPGRWGKAADPELRYFVNSITADGGTSLYDAMLAGLAELERAEAEDLVGRGVENAEQGGSGATEAADEDETTEASPPQERQGSQAAGAGPPVELPPKSPSLLADVGSVIRDLDLHTPPPIRGCGEPLPVGVRPDPTNTRRKALVVLSDGADVDSEASFYEALQAARSASVPVFPVAMGYADDDPNLMANLAELARATGGRLITNTTSGRLGGSYDEVLSLLRSFYLIGYDPGFREQAAGRPLWHDVRVELRRPNFEPLVRPGYYR